MTCLRKSASAVSATSVERIRILDDLRAGTYDVLIGVNLLREGLDLPEVSLVAILDADKEGFLRSHRSLTQTVGRAARNLNGRVIMYADKITDSMRQTIDETERRRAIQMKYNSDHDIIPQAIIKARTPIITVDGDAAPATTASTGRSTGRAGERPRTKSTGYAYAESVDMPSVDVAADPVIPYMTREELERSIAKQRDAMVKAAKNMEFLEAARLRDEILKSEEYLKQKFDVKD